MSDPDATQAMATMPLPQRVALRVLDNAMERVAKYEGDLASAEAHRDDILRFCHSLGVSADVLEARLADSSQPMGRTKLYEKVLSVKKEPWLDLSDAVLQEQANQADIRKLRRQVASLARALGMEPPGSTTAAS
jgi:hypothetical protein